MTTEQEPSPSLSPAAIQRLVDSHRQFLAFLQARVESRAVAEDILQSAFVRGLERGADVRDEESAVAWFYRVLRNAVIDHYRHRAATGRALEGWGKEFVTQEAPQAELKQEICQCVSGLLETLKPDYQAALRIVDLEEGSLQDLAKAGGDYIGKCCGSSPSGPGGAAQTGAHRLRKLCGARLPGLSLQAQGGHGLPTGRVVNRLVRSAANSIIPPQDRDDLVAT